MEYKHLCTTRQLSFRHVEKMGIKRCWSFIAPRQRRFTLDHWDVCGFHYNLHCCFHKGLWLLL